MKNIRIVHGTLMYPLEVGSRALIFEDRAVRRKCRHKKRFKKCS